MQSHLGLVAERINQEFGTHIKGSYAKIQYYRHVKPRYEWEESGQEFDRGYAQS